jgi:hypothetical protein
MIVQRALFLGHSVDDVDRALDLDHQIDVRFHLIAIVTGAERSDHKATLHDHLSAGIAQLSAGILFHGLPHVLHYRDHATWRTARRKHTYKFREGYRTDSRFAANYSSQRNSKFKF